jgi:quercetin dioxygenase-like cupin family protein
MHWTYQAQWPIMPVKKNFNDREDDCHGKSVLVRKSREETMDRSVIALGLIVASGLTTAAIDGQHARADEKKEVYVSPGADKKTLVNEPLYRVAAQIVTIDHYTMPAGWTGGRHYHTGPVYVYVLDGSFTIDEQGKERRTFRAGELYKEPIGIPMQARNLSASEPLKIVVFQVTPEGEPQMVKAE